MLTELVTFLEGFIITYSLGAIFFGSVLQEIIDPIPSTAVIIGSSFFIMENIPISLHAF